MRVTTFILPALLTFSAAAPGQCLFTGVTTQIVGQSCNFGHTGCCATLVAPVAYVVPDLDIANCQLDVTVTGFEGCCGVTTPLRVLAIGFQPTFVPLPEFGLGCALQVDPIAILMTTASVIPLTLPPGVPQLTFRAQGIAWSHWAPSPEPDVLVFTAPVSISLQ
jgi:hypothetical protein